MSNINSFLREAHRYSRLIDQCKKHFENVEGFSPVSMTRGIEIDCSLLPQETFAKLESEVYAARARRGVDIASDKHSDIEESLADALLPTTEKAEGPSSKLN